MPGVALAGHMLVMVRLFPSGSGEAGAAPRPGLWTQPPPAALRLVVRVVGDQPCPSVGVQELQCDVSVEEDSRQEWTFTLYDFDNNGKVTREVSAPVGSPGHLSGPWAWGPGPAFTSADLPRPCRSCSRGRAVAGSC